MNAKAPTVTGCIALEPNISANTKLFHAYMKHKRDAAAMPVESFIKYFKNEFLNYIKEDNLSNLTNFKINSKTNKKEFVLHKK